MPGAEVDFAAVMARVRRVIDEGTDYYERLLAERGVDLVRLPARFVGPNEIEAGDLRVRFRHALIASGARPRTLDVPGADTVPTVDSDDLMHVTELPGHLVCVGAGAVSLEFAQAYRRLGADVTIVQRGPHLAHGEDEELGDLLKAYLEEEGIRVLTDSAVVGLELVDGRPAVVGAGATASSATRCSSRSAARRSSTGSASTTSASPTGRAGSSRTATSARRYRTCTRWATPTAG